MRTTTCMVCLLVVFAFAVGCMGSDDGTSDATDQGGPDSTGSADNPYDGLWDVGMGEIKCNGESCCFKRCTGNEETICVTRDMDFIIESIGGDPLPEDCDQIIFPEWFYNLDCFVGVGTLINPLNGDKDIYEATYNADDGRMYFTFLQCFCGRTSSTYSSQYSVIQVFDFEDCNTPLSSEDGYDEEFVNCDNPCNPCTPQCGAKECGFDGCGGSCGTCPPGKTCSGAGQCVSEEDTCSACLASCHGLPGCCTGCGCICEEACGQCF